MPSDGPSGHRPVVGLFVTCLVDLFRPSVGFAAVKLLEEAGCEVRVPPKQVCCGQPAYNSGDNRDARKIAEQVIAAFEEYDYVVGPSGSCMATIRHEYPKLFAADPVWLPRAQALAARAHELLSFLVNERKYAPRGVRCAATATYHDSCSGLREMGIKDEPRRLLSAVTDLTLSEMQDAETCCGFGGTFCVKYPNVSVKMVDDKIANATQTGAQLLLGGDLGCLLNIAGRVARERRPLRVFHAAEVLAGFGDAAAIGEAEPSK